MPPAYLRWGLSRDSFQCCPDGDINSAFKTAMKTGEPSPGKLKGGKRWNMFANAGFSLRTPQRVPPWRLPWGGLATTRLCGCWSISVSPQPSRSPFSQLSHFTSGLRIPPELSLLLIGTDRIHWHGCANYNANHLKDIIVAAKK